MLARMPWKTPTRRSNLHNHYGNYWYPRPLWGIIGVTPKRLSLTGENRHAPNVPHNEGSHEEDSPARIAGDRRQRVVATISLGVGQRTLRHGAQLRLPKRRQPDRLGPVAKQPAGRGRSCRPAWEQKPARCARLRAESGAVRGDRAADARAGCRARAGA